MLEESPGEAEGRDPQGTWGSFQGNVDIFYILMFMVLWVYTYINPYQVYSLSMLTLLYASFTPIKLLKIAKDSKKQESTTCNKNKKLQLLFN